MITEGVGSALPIAGFADTSLSSAQSVRANPQPVKGGWSSVTKKTMTLNQDLTLNMGGMALLLQPVNAFEDGTFPPAFVGTYEEVYYIFFDDNPNPLMFNQLAYNSNDGTFGQSVFFINNFPFAKLRIRPVMVGGRALRITVFENATDIRIVG